MAHLRAPASVGLAARSGRQRIGFAVMQVANAAAHLDLLGVLPAFRRRGVASRLLAQLERHALELGAARLTLELRESNAAGRRFYEALGYRECGREAHYYCGRETAVHMQRALATGTDQRWPDGARPI
ncbi:MAG: GNAT family N-acetyltransferase [Gammaproteobacteria bacterium]|nr:GNAT family N-acetyltransferase [Gammaproteobacteria bacterium]